MVVDSADLDPGLFAHLARDRIFEALAGLDKARERPIAVADEHDDGRVGAREMHRVAAGVGAPAHVPGLLAARRTAAKPAMAMPRVPEHHRAGECQQCPLAALDARPDLAEIGKPN